MIAETPIVFPSGSTMLSGVVIRETPNSGARQIAVMVTGSWLTVKEQMGGNLCRCSAYPQITAAVLDAAQTMGKS